MTQPDNLEYTDLLDQHDIPKYDLRIEILGTLDEASSVLGVARATTSNKGIAAIILDIQHDLCWMMAELAATTKEAHPGVRITVERERWLVNTRTRLQTETSSNPDLSIPNSSSVSSFIQLARAIVRRAERQVAALNQQGVLQNPQIMTYLNKLSPLLLTLAHYEDRR